MRKSDISEVRKMSKNQTALITKASALSAERGDIFYLSSRIRHSENLAFTVKPSRPDYLKDEKELI